MATIDLKLKTYEQLQFEVNRLMIDNFLKQKELDKHKNNWEELKKYLEQATENLKIIEHDDYICYENVLNKMKELEEKNNE